MDGVVAHKFAFACAGPDRFIDSAKVSVFSGITRLVHHYDFLPIEMVCYVLTGTSGADDVAHSYTDASWTLRNRSYDTMSPDEIRAAARSARQTRQLRGSEDVLCSAFAIIGSQGSTAYDRMHSGLQSAADRAWKRKLDALESESTPAQNVQEAVVNEPDNVDSGSGDDDDILAFLGM